MVDFKNMKGGDPEGQAKNNSKQPKKEKTIAEAFNHPPYVHNPIDDIHELAETIRASARATQEMIGALGMEIFVKKVSNHKSLILLFETVSDFEDYVEDLDEDYIVEREQLYLREKLEDIRNEIHLIIDDGLGRDTKVVELMGMARAFRNGDNPL